MDESSDEPVDNWTTKEKLTLAACVQQNGCQNWSLIAKNLCFGIKNLRRPSNWYSPKLCALQYKALLKEYESLGNNQEEGSDETNLDLIVKFLKIKRLNEMKKIYGNTFEIIFSTFDLINSMDKNKPETIQAAAKSLKEMQQGLYQEFTLKPAMIEEKAFADRKNRLEIKTQTVVPVQLPVPEPVKCDTGKEIIEANDNIKSGPEPQSIDQITILEVKTKKSKSKRNKTIVSGTSDRKTRLPVSVPIPEPELVKCGTEKEVIEANDNIKSGPEPQSIDQITTPEVKTKKSKSKRNDTIISGTSDRKIGLSVPEPEPVKCNTEKEVIEANDNIKSEPEFQSLDQITAPEVKTKKSKSKRNKTVSGTSNRKTRLPVSVPIPEPELVKCGTEKEANDNIKSEPESESLDQTTTPEVKTKKSKSKRNETIFSVTSDRKTRFSHKNKSFITPPTPKKEEEEKVEISIDLKKNKEAILKLLNGAESKLGQKVSSIDEKFIHKIIDFKTIKSKIESDQLTEEEFENEFLTVLFNVSINYDILGEDEAVIQEITNIVKELYQMNVNES